MDSAAFWGKLRKEVEENNRKQYVTDSKEKWLLLRNCWNRFAREQRELILEVARIEKAPAPLETFSTDEKRRISLAVCRLRWFASSDRALNGDEIRRYENLSRGKI